MDMNLNDTQARDLNKDFWNTTADQWFGTTALPEYGVHFVTENELHLFGDVSGKKMLEIGCGSGHSLVYHAKHGAGELWGVDISEHQLANAKKHLTDNNVTANLICSPMENECGLPTEYFDIMYSIYAIGWTMDLTGTFKRLATYLKKDGIFIFSWKHPLLRCVYVENKKLIFENSYFDEELYSMQAWDQPLLLRNYKISTYINALAEAGFVIEKMIEQSSDEVLAMTGDIDDKVRRAQSLPLSFVFKVRKG